MFTDTNLELVWMVAKEKNHALLKESRMRLLLKEQLENHSGLGGRIIEKLLWRVSWLPQLKERAGWLAKPLNGRIAVASGGK